MGAYRDEHGTWHYHKRIKLPDGERTRVKGTPALNTKACAEQAERAHIERALRGTLGPDAQPKEVLTLAKFVEEIWWPKYKLGGGKRGVNGVTTLMGKESNLRVHILPQLGALKLDKITNERVTEFFGRLREQGYGKKGRRTLSQKPKAIQKRKERLVGRKDRGLPRKGLSEKSVKNVRTTLHTILVYAVKWGRLSRMPDLPEVAVPESSFDWYRPEEAAALINATQEPWERALLMFPLHTGVRLGEQRAVRWTDIDFKLNRVHIRRSAPKGLDIEKAPKSNRQRWVDLTPELSSALQAIRPVREPRSGGLIFCREDGSKLQPGQFHEVLWAAQKRAGLRRIKWHELRHSFASILASGGTPLFVLKSLLGHASIEMTERYAHIATEQRAAYAHLLSSAAPSSMAAREIGPALAPTPPRSLN
jgi:integrase